RRARGRPPPPPAAWPRAASRCACKEWRRARRRLPPPPARGPPPALAGRHPPQLPRLAVHTQFLSRPTTGAAVSCRLDYTVPPPPPPCPPSNTSRATATASSSPTSRHGENEYLVFDPTLTPNYELFIVPDHVPYKLREEEECEECEWPPWTYIDPTCVFIQDWFLGGEEICSGRGGCRDVTRSNPFCDHQCGYWRRALYICCSY
ncbi:Os07g0182601, partial [Oryza sativa Japonica Group]